MLLAFLLRVFKQTKLFCHLFGMERRKSINEEVHPWLIILLMKKIRLSIHYYFLDWRKIERKRNPWWSYFLLYMKDDNQFDHWWANFLWVFMLTSCRERKKKCCRLLSIEYSCFFSIEFLFYIVYHLISSKWLRHIL